MYILQMNKKLIKILSVSQRWCCYLQHESHSSTCCLGRTGRNFEFFL